MGETFYKYFCIGNLILSFVVGMYYIIIGTSTLFSTQGQLTASDVYTSNGGYYVEEQFAYFHFNKNQTCFLVRPTYYIHKSDANLEAQSKILGTYRQIWITSYDSHKCMDFILKQSNTDIGIVFLVYFACAVVSMILVFKFGINCDRTNLRQHSMIEQIEL